MKIIWKKISGKEVTSAVAGFNAGALSWSNWDLEMLVFVEGEKSSKQGETQQQHQPTYMVLGQNRTIGGSEHSHHRTIPTPLFVSSGVYQITRLT